MTPIPKSNLKMRYDYEQCHKKFAPEYVNCMMWSSTLTFILTLYDTYTREKKKWNDHRDAIYFKISQNLFHRKSVHTVVSYMCIISSIRSRGFIASEWQRSNNQANHLELTLQAGLLKNKHGKIEFTQAWQT